MISWIDRTVARVRALFLKSKLDNRLKEEIAAHIEMAAEENMRRGMGPSAARREAHLRFGSFDAAMELHRETRGIPVLESFLQDVFYAFRQLRHNPTFTIVTVLTLGLGIGANSAIFSLANSLMLRALPVAEPQNLAIVRSGTPGTQGSRSVFSYPIWDQIRRRAPMFGGAAAWVDQRFDLAQGGEREPVDGIFASGEFFTTLGVPAFLGRTFMSADDVRGGGPDAVAVISYGLWRRRFGGASNVIGTPIIVERVPFTIIGVTPPGFFGAEVGRAFDVALPLGAEPLIRGKDSDLDEPARSWLTVLLRLKPGQSSHAASAMLNTVLAQILEAGMRGLPSEVLRRFPFLPFTLEPAAAGTSLLRTRYQRPVLIILIIVALVLVIACVNVSNLLLARATSRRHEFSVRLALGASRRRLVRQSMVESLLLAGIGAAAGLVFAAWGSRALVAQLSTSANRVFLDLPLDWRVMAFTAVVTIATAVLFGAAPAFSATRSAPIDVLKEHGRRARGDTRMSLSSGLVVTQIAVSLVLVVAAGLFVRTFERLASTPLGLDSDRVLMVNVDMTRAHVEPADRLSFYRQLADAAAVPGVAHAAGSFNIPLSGINDNLADVTGAPPMSDGDRYVRMNFITPEWFATYGIAIHTGRDIDDRDDAAAPPVALVNETFTRKFFSGRNAIGSTLAYLRGPGGGTRRTVIGVVGDSIYGSLREEVQPTIYLPLAQQDVGRARSDITIGVRASAGSPVLLAPSVAAALIAVDPDLTFSFQSLTDRVHASLMRERLVAVLSGFFGALALLLAGLGLYGVASYAVSRRRSEIGIRIALGANPGGVMRLVLSRVFVLIGLGLVIGGAVSLWASRFVATLLYGLEPRDLSTLIGAAALLGAIGGIAAFLPAWRAARTDPAEVLRSE
jgi:putative ABC transport system permease protein